MADDFADFIARPLADQGFKALGRYIAEFSELIGDMQMQMVQRLQHPDDPPTLAWIPFGGATARDITDQFFAMARLLEEHDETELAIAAKLKSEVLKEVKLRNDVAHGEWNIGYSETEAGEPVSWAMRIKPDRKEGLFDLIEENLDERSNALAWLRHLVRTYGSLCFKLDYRVGDVLEITGKPGKQREVVLRSREHRARLGLETP